MGTWCNGSTLRSHRRNEGSIPFVSNPLSGKHLREFATLRDAPRNPDCVTLSIARLRVVAPLRVR